MPLHRADIVTAYDGRRSDSSQFADLPVQPHLQKYFGSVFTQITSIPAAVSSLNKGRFAIVTDVGMGCGGRGWRF
jgi:hypothetical protein